MFYKILSLLFITSILLACSDEQRSKEQLNTQEETSRITEYTIDSLEVFADFETHNIIEPFELEILGNGNLAIADIKQQNVTLVQPDGRLITTFGREGKGPGEFIGLNNLFDMGSIIHVVDSKQQVLAKYTRDGNFISSQIFETLAISKEVVPISHSKYAIAAGGENGSLIMVNDFDTDSSFYFGTIKGENLKNRDFKNSMTQINNGEVPDFLKANIILRFEGDNIYAYLESFSKLHKYDIFGNLIWGHSIELPYNEEIFNTALDRAERMRGMGMIPTINYINDFEVINQEVVILTDRDNSDDPQLLVRLDKAGNIKAIYTLPTHLGYLSCFDWDTEKGVIYFSSQHLGVVYKRMISF